MAAGTLTLAKDGLGPGNFGVGAAMLASDTCLAWSQTLMNAVIQPKECESLKVLAKQAIKERAF